MAVSGNELISAENLASALGIDADGPTGYKPISAENLLSVISSLPADLIYDGPPAASVSLPSHASSWSHFFFIVYMFPGVTGSKVGEYMSAIPSYGVWQKSVGFNYMPADPLTLGSYDQYSAWTKLDGSGTKFVSGYSSPYGITKLVGIRSGGGRLVDNLLHLLLGVA